MADYDSHLHSLYHNIGSIAVQWGSIERFIHGDLRDTSVGHEFGRQFKLWKQLAIRAIRPNPEELERIENVATRVCAAREMRDALVHGQPTLKVPFDGSAPTIECTLMTEKKGLLKREVERLLRTVPIPREFRHLARAAFHERAEAMKEVKLTYLTLDVYEMAQTNLREISRSLWEIRIAAMKASRRNRL